MSSRKSSRKKGNQFALLDDSNISTTQDPDQVDPGSTMNDPDSKNFTSDSDLKSSFETFKQTTLDQFTQIEISYHRMNQSMNELHDGIGKLLSRQNPTSTNSSHAPDDYDPSVNMTSMNNKGDTTFEPNQNSTSVCVPPKVPSDPPPLTQPYLTDPNQTPQDSTNPTFTSQPIGTTTTTHNTPPTPSIHHRFWKIVRDDNLETH